MSQTDTSELVSDKAVLSILKKASADFILPRYKRLSDKDISTKTSATDYVTVADRDAEAYITPKLLNILPGSLCIGEESVAEGRCDINALDGDYIWTVDPIDGTRNFVAGQEHFCCMVSLIEQGKFLQSWIYRPLVGDAIVASKNKGVNHYLATGEIVACRPRRRQNEMPLLQRHVECNGF